MLKNKLYNKVIKADIKATLRNKGYAFFDKGLYNLNIIGIRKNNDNKVTNKYDDVICVVYKDEKGWKKVCYTATTEPGTYYMKKVLGNPKGTAIVVPGQYRGCWKIGRHNNKYKALVQSKPIKVYRDGNKDDIYDMYPEKIFKGNFGINIHRSNQGFTRESIDMYSAGCQVFNNPKQFKEFMELCEKQRQIYGNSFTYTLINEQDLI